ncbi:hypothetical protein [Thalassoglobus sp.]|uniref:hypothetical protein n=1 Tax=Thalassoglobus sp. TaxID=2795869 RepID=UPI003AA97C66
MKRMMTLSLGVVLLVASGCGTVRGVRLASIESACFGTNTSEQSLTAPPVEYIQPVEEPRGLAPVPPSASDLPMEQEELPPPPPANFEVTSGLQRTVRKPILIPIQQTAARWSDTVLTKLQ